MSKFSGPGVVARPKGPTGTTHRIRTFEGGAGFALDAKTELFTAAVTGFGAEDTFYERAVDRDSRVVALIEQVTTQDPDWMAAFTVWLRETANMRTMSVICSVEYARIVSPDANTSGRALIRDTLDRADEPAEALAYWLARYGRPVKGSVKRGVADAAVRLYDQFSAVKYDSAKHRLRMGDVIEICHPSPVNELQSDLFQYLLSKRHRGGEARIPESLLDTRQYLNWVKSPTLRDLPNLVTWENLSAHFPMDAACWEAAIPKMGYMALLRNLRNFEQAGVSHRTLDRIATRLADVEQVERSRQLPFRFYSAYRNVHSDRFRWPLSQALEHSLVNVPQLPGHTLVLIDTSGSMRSGYSYRGTLAPVTQAALFGCAVATRSEQHSTAIFADYADWISVQGGVLRTVDQIESMIGRVGNGTRIWQSLEWCIRRSAAEFDRVFIFTDMQEHPGRQAIPLPSSVPVHVWDCSGHGRVNLELGSGRYLHAGLSDQSFRTVQLLEQFKPGRWPWEA